MGYFEESIANIRINHPNYTGLFLNDEYITTEKLKILVESLKNNDKVKYINLCENKIDYHGAVYVAQILKDSQIINNLNLYKNNIGDEGATTIAEAVNVNNTLNFIGLADNNIGNQGAIALAEALKTNTSIKEIILSDNNIKTKGAIALSEVFKVNNTIENINLDNLKIDDEGIKAIAEALKENNSITCINLSENSIGYIKTKAIAEALNVNKTITNIYLKSNAIGNESAIELAKMFKINNTIKEIDLYNNQISLRGVKAIAEALKENNSIKQIDLSYNDICDDGINAFIETLKVNNTITTLAISKDNISEDLYSLLRINNLLAGVDITDSKLITDMVFDMKNKGNKNISLNKEILDKARVDELAKLSIISASFIENECYSNSKTSLKEIKAKTMNANKMIAISIFKKVSNNEDMPEFEDLYKVAKSKNEQISALDILANNISPLEFQKFQNKMLQVYKLTPEKVEKMPNSHFKKALKKHFEKHTYLKKMREQRAGGK